MPGNMYSTPSTEQMPITSDHTHPPPSYPHQPSSDVKSASYTQPQQPYQQAPPQANYQHQQQQQPTPQGANHYQAVTPLASLQSTPALVDCPACGTRQMTTTDYVSGGTTHVSAILLCFCLCLGCIPYMASWFKDCEHKCGHCGALLAVWHRSGRTEVLTQGGGVVMK